MRAGRGPKGRRHGRGGRGLVVLSLAAVALMGACTASPKPQGSGTAGTGGGSVEGTQIDELPTAPTTAQAPPAPDLSTVAGQTIFLNQVFADVQSMWRKDFSEGGLAYTPATLDIFRSTVVTACGRESAEVGPFYCPVDHTVYLDLQFFTAMQQQFGVTGDFAEAYVVAHEMGHHVQNLVGVSGRVARAEQAAPSITNALSVRVELQADCLAGVWAHSAYTRHLLEPGDIEEALHAAQVVGDDFLAQASGSTVDPDSWTHGSAAQRTHWFTTGYQDGSPDECDTFAGVPSSTPAT